MAQITQEQFARIKSIVGVTTLLGAADDDKIVTSANMKVGSYTIAAQPASPARISVTATAVGTADTLGIITITGTLAGSGKTDTEVITPVAGSAVYGAKYFSAITSVVGSGWVIDGGAGNDTIKVGVSMDVGYYFENQDITLMCVSGNIWFNSLSATAVADATAFKLTAGQTIDLNVATYLSLISDSSGATFQIIRWKRLFE